MPVSPFSVNRLAYVVQGRRLLFGSTLDALTLTSQKAFELDPQSVYDYVYFHVVPGPHTIYREPRYVAPGHYVLFDADGRIEERQFSSVAFVENKRVPLVELKARFMEILQRAVADCAKDARCGTFLSGGTDSST